MATHKERSRASVNAWRSRSEAYQRSEKPCGGKAMMLPGVKLWLTPLAAGPLPPQLAAYIHPAVDAQGLTVKAVLEQDRDAIYHAVMQDPIVQARLTLDDTWQMTDELIAAETEWLPEWLGGTTYARTGT